MRAQLASLVLAALLLSGCGSGSDSDIPYVDDPSIPITSDIGIAAFQFFLARAVPSDVDIIEFYGYAENGELIYGPAPRNKAQEIVLTNLPLDIRVFRLDYYDGDFLVGQGEVPIILSPNGRVSVSNPDFVDVSAVSLAVIPETLEVAFGTTRRITVNVTLSNGDNFSVSDEATYTSRNGTIASVDSKGVVTGLGLGSTEIVIEYRGLTEIVAVNVVPATP